MWSESTLVRSCSRSCRRENQRFWSDSSWSRISVDCWTSSRYSLIASMIRLTSVSFSTARLLSQFEVTVPLLSVHGLTNWIDVRATSRDVPRLIPRISDGPRPAGWRSGTTLQVRHDGVRRLALPERPAADAVSRGPQRRPEPSALHEAVQLRRGEGLVEVAERPLPFHLAGGVEQTTHRRTVERRGEADPPDAGGRELGHRERLAPDAHHEVDRLGHPRAAPAHPRQGRQARPGPHGGPGPLDGPNTP